MWKRGLSLWKASLTMPVRVTKKRQKVHAHFLNRGKWWVAWTDDVPGAVTQGRTLNEARENLKDAVALMLEPAGRASPSEATPETRA